MRSRIERDRAADDVAPPTESLEPEGVAQHDDTMVSRLVLFSAEPAAENRLHAEHVEEARAHLCAVDADRGAGTGDGIAPGIDRRHVVNVRFCARTSRKFGGDIVESSLVPRIWWKTPTSCSG